MRYKVKFEWDGETRFGVAESYGEEAEQAKAEGKCIVADAVTPERFLVPEDNITDIPHGDWADGDIVPGYGRICDEYDQYIYDQWKQHKEAEECCPDDGELYPGMQFQIGVADGYAHYVVVKVMKKNCDVEWRGFCPDRYVDHHFGYGGRFPIADIKRYVIPSSLFRKNKCQFA